MYLGFAEDILGITVVCVFAWFWEVGDGLGGLEGAWGLGFRESPPKWHTIDTDSLYPLDNLGVYMLL